MDDEIQEEPYGTPHGIVVLGASGDDEASPDESPPIARSRFRENVGS